MRSIGEVIEGIGVAEVIGRTEIEIQAPEIDSRKVIKGGAFVAIKGTQTDGHKFIENAVQGGARAIICQELPKDPDENVTWIRVEDSAEAAAICAHNYFGKPSYDLDLVGVTGTNGKTTTVTLLYDLFTRMGYTTGLISTVAGNGTNGIEIYDGDSNNTQCGRGFCRTDDFYAGTGGSSLRFNDCWHLSGHL